MLAGCGGGGISGGGEGSLAPPNVLVILIDCLRAGRSPHIRRRFRRWLDRPPAAVAIAESGSAVWVRSATHTLLVSKEDGSAQLFDRRAEALEQTDLAASEPATVAELRAQLSAWRAALDPVRPHEIHLGDKTVKGLKALGYID